MSRYGWSSRPQLSPFTSSIGGGPPRVTDEDFSYITSQDLHDADSYPSSGPEDDVLLIKSGGTQFEARFPAYSIGDGKLYVRDVRDRVGLVMGLSDRRTRRVKLVYKGRQLKEPAALVRDYGVKNNSQILAIIPEDPSSARAGSDSGEEMVVVTEASSPQGSNATASEAGEPGKKPRRRTKKGKKKGSVEATSPQDSSSNLSIPSPQPGGNSRPQSPAGALSGAMAGLEELSELFDAQMLPLCEDFIAAPPQDQRKREDAHRRISETVLQQILLKLDAIEPNGDAHVRARRKDLVKYVQAVLKSLDDALGR